MTSEEFTNWRKASYSAGNSGCVEVATEWRKASYSYTNSNCVELVADRRAVGVRDTAQRGNGQVLEFPVAAWRVFIANAKGENA